MRDLALRLSMYSEANKGFVPFAYHFSTRSNDLYSPNGVAIPAEAFESAADYWTYSFMDDFGNNWFSPSLVCPNDKTSEARQELAVSVSGDYRNHISVPLTRSVSRSFYIDHRNLRRDEITWTPASNKVARQYQVSFPSAKSLLVEKYPFHNDYMVGQANNPYLDEAGHRMVSAADLSVSLRAVEDANAPVLTSLAMPTYTSEGYARFIEKQRWWVTFDYTRNGVLGRDW